MPGAGKGTCAAYLSDKYGWPLIHFGNMVYDEVQRRGLNNVRDEKTVREDMRKTEGPAVLAQHVANKAQEFIANGQKTVVLDGLYSWSEFKYLEKTFGPHLVLIAIVAPKNLRRQRVLERRDNYRSYTLEQLITREVAEIEGIEKGGPIAYADYVIVNDGTPKELIEKLENILANLENNPAST